jgi:hypothetical protein
VAAAAGKILWEHYIQTAPDADAAAHLSRYSHSVRKAVYAFSGRGDSRAGTKTIAKMLHLCSVPINPNKHFERL